jgi:hypothetical protein
MKARFGGFFYDRLSASLSPRLPVNPSTVLAPLICSGVNLGGGGMSHAGIPAAMVR